MGSGFGIAAIVVFCLSLGVPLIGNFITLLALVLVVFSAIGGNKIWPIAISAASAVKLFFLSPTWMAAIYQDLTWMVVTLAFIAAPIVAMVLRGGGGSAIVQRLTPASQTNARRGGDDVADWDRIQNKDDLDSLQEYLLRHPQGRFAELARMKLERAGVAPLAGPSPVTPSSTEREQSAPSTPEPSAPARQRKLAPFWLVVVPVLLVGLAGGAYFWWRQNGAEVAAINPADVAPAQPTEPEGSAATEQFTDPIAYCRAVVEAVPGPDERYVGGEVEWLRTQLGIRPDQPANIVWRCVDGQMQACAELNTPICAPVETSAIPSADLRQFCRENPDTDAIPRIYGGFGGSAHEWRCTNGRPHTVGASVELDEFGFRRDAYVTVSPPDATP